MLCLLVGASLIGWVGVFLGHGAVALILTYSGIPLGIAATVLMQQRLTRLWAAG